MINIRLIFKKIILICNKILNNNRNKTTIINVIFYKIKKKIT